jgi:hypothetical protein
MKSMGWGHGLGWGAAWVIPWAGLAIALPSRANPIPTRAAVESLVFTPINLNASRQTVYNNSAIAIFPPYRDLLGLATNADGNSRTVVYWLYQAGKPPLEVVVERDGDRMLLVDRTPRQERKLRKKGQVVAAYQTVGLPSRVFPGLVGVQVIPPETVRSVSVWQETAIADSTEVESTTAISTDTIFIKRILSQP